MPLPLRSHRTAARHTAARHAAHRSLADTAAGAARVATRAAGVPVVLATVVTASAPGWTTYLIQPGDTASGIAARHGTTVSALVEANGLAASGDRIYAGRSLQVPTTGSSGGSLIAAGHTVVRGDTVIGLARRYGVSRRALRTANDIPATGAIFVGQRLSIPGPAAARTSVPNTFAGRAYPDSVAGAAARNRETLAARGVASPAEVGALIIRTAERYGVDPSLALAISWQESGFNQRKVSVANAIGAMQVIPASGQWVSGAAGRDLDLLDTEDNVLAGVLVLKALRRSATSEEQAIAAYYQGLRSVRERGMLSDTRRYVANVQALRDRFSQG
jgi:LysM repeat protein